MKGIFKFHANCGRMGDLYGLFIAEKEDVAELIKSEREVDFGEVLGKHSEIEFSIEDSDVTLISDSPKTVAQVELLEMEVGYNPVAIDKENRDD